MITPKLLPVALLMMAGATGAPSALAEAPATTELKVEFTYQTGAPASVIYADLERTARDACRASGTRSLRQQLQEKACARDLLNSAVTRVGRADVAQLHQNQLSGPYASAG
ncbi:MAG TPA: hypothetical protein VG942_04000 [Hyphomonadaceae bacterium]|nr:hypothetical protein [Hyphomonadaceae bacterium]